MSIGGIVLLYGNTNGYDEAEHKDKKVQVNTRMSSTPKNELFICCMNQGETLRHHWLDLWELLLI